MPDIDPLLQLQNDATHKLNSEEYFANISVKSLRQMVVTKEVDEQMPHIAGKANKVGCGVLVGMPTVDGIDANLPGPQDEILFPIDVIENPELNLHPDNGTVKTAEEVARAVRRHIHHLSIEGLMFLYHDKNAISPIEDIERIYPGCVGYRVLLRARLAESAPAKVVIPEISEVGLSVTLTNNTPGATIYYTTDKTFPGSGNSAAQVYAAPFNVVSGTTVRFAAYKTGTQGSDVGQVVIT